MSEILKYNLGNAGYERYVSDVRQLGGFLMVFAMSALTIPQARLAMWLGHDDNPDPQTDLLELVQVIGGLCQVLFGTVGLWVGYLAIGHDWVSQLLTRFLVGLTVLAFIPLGSELADVIHNTAKGSNDSPFFGASAAAASSSSSSWDPTLQEVRFIGSMGFIGTLGWYGGMLASLAFCERALLVFAQDQPELRNRAFYQSRLVFFSILMLVAALSQLLLGAFALMQFGTGPFVSPLRVAMYVIHFPEIAIAVGGFQTLTAIMGLLRAAGRFYHPDNHVFQLMVGLSWFGTLVGTTMIQVYYSAPRMVDATRAPTLVVLTLGLHLLPAFLDFKMRNLPFEFPHDFYDPPMRDTTTAANGHKERETDSSDDDDDNDDGMGIVAEEDDDGLGVAEDGDDDDVFMDKGAGSVPHDVAVV